MVKQYSFIYDPTTNQKISIFSNNGCKLLQNYIRLINGGAYMTRSKTKALNEKKKAAAKKKTATTRKKTTITTKKKNTTTKTKKKTIPKRLRIRVTKKTTNVAKAVKAKATKAKAAKKKRVELDSDSGSDSDSDSLSAISREFDQDDSDIESEDVCLYDTDTGKCYNDNEELVSDIRCKRNHRDRCVPRSKVCIKYKYLEKV
mgnify:CR=1 FL=1